ncbi:MAG: phosphate/phosphite/phosphonate ABC transporter substrate-binding protein [Candidatus Sumerlaeaceae bacterium]|nr:phosphate/phosphite/phosphonate ABC transporter substrate-binding protein [Candidatus Sumerlaeaceae bacterium]
MVPRTIAVKAKLTRGAFQLLCAAFLLLGAEPRSSSAVGDAPTSAPFRIGYLRGDPEAPLDSGVFFRLREYLLARPPIRDAVTSGAVSDIVLLASDSHQDLIQRMDQNEFDLVFCSSIDYVTQTGDYEAIYQLRRSKRDRFDPRGSRVFHSGVIFVNNRSPLFSGDITPARLADYFQRREIAMVGSFSAAGYVYPRLKIASLTTGTADLAVRFCDTPEEVVKYVINGVVEVGAADNGVIEEVLSSKKLDSELAKLVRVVIETDNIPTDPVALRRKWLPRNSDLGREIRDGIRQFFARDKQLPQLQASSSEKFEDLRQNLVLFRALPR